jgi:glucose-6-phosphate isomerase
VASPTPASEGTYADLQVLVPKLAEAQGRSAAVAIFNQLGVESGKDLQAKHPEKIGAAVKLFRAALGE